MILAQHGYSEGDKIEKGLEKGYIQGCIFNPKDISLQALKEKIVNYPKSETYFDPLFYASIIAQQYGSKSRLGKLMSDYSYFSPKQYRDLRREKYIREEIEKCLSFQNSINLENFILPNILIQDGLSSESSAIAKNFLEIGSEIANEQSLQDNSFLTLALGRSCFSNLEMLIGFVDEITGFNLNVKGFYLLAETTKDSASDPWYFSETLQAQMYLTYALSQAGYKVIHGFSIMSAPFLFAAGCSSVAFGWYDTLRYFSLDRFIPRNENERGQKPNRRYLSKKLWHRIKSSEAASFPLLRDEPLYIDPDSTDTDEILQHWQTVGDICGEIKKIKSYTGRLVFLLNWLEQSKIYKSELLIPISKFDNQYRNCRLAINGFAEFAEIPLSAQN
jgi:hypothetical protein